MIKYTNDLASESFGPYYLTSLCNNYNSDSDISPRATTVQTVEYDEGTPYTDAIWQGKFEDGFGCKLTGDYGMSF